MIITHPRTLAVPAFRSAPFLFLAVSVGLLLAGMALAVVLPVAGNWPVVVAPWLFFVVLTAGILALGRATVGHRNPNLFSGIALGGSMIKLFGSLLFLFVYQKLAQPSDRSHLGLFFLYYAGFTVLEIVLLQRMVREEAERRGVRSDSAVD